MILDHALEIAGIVIEIALLAMLVHRSVARTLPVFFLYCVWAFASDAISSAMQIFSPSHYGIVFYLTGTIGDLALQFCVLVEIAWSVLRPIRSRLSANALWVVAAAILAVGAAVWPFAELAAFRHLSTSWRCMAQLQQTASILRILFFLLLAAGSQLFSLGWRDRELQVATGFGFYSLVSITVAVANAHHTSALQFTFLYRIVALSFVGSLCYWTASFARAEARRREFTPRMQSMLLEIAATARVTCGKLAESTSAPPTTP